MSRSFLGQSYVVGQGCTFEVPASGLRLRDSDRSHALTLSLTSNLTGDRTLSLATGDSDRTLDISAADVAVSAFGASLVDDAAASNARTTLGGTTVGQSFFTLTNPSAITFPRMNADNSVSALSAANFKTALSLTSSDVGLGSVTNDAQTKASIVPNTAPSAGQVLVGNAGGTAYAPQTLSGSGATMSLASTGVLTISSIANASLSNSSLTVTAGTALSGGGSVSLGGSVTLNLAATIPQAETIDVTTNTAVPSVLTLQHDRTSGTPTAGDGAALDWNLQSTTTQGVLAMKLYTSWSVATHASRKPAGGCNLYDATGAVSIWSASTDGSGVGSFGVLGSSSPKLASPDLGTLTNAFGFSSGTPTFGAANLTGTTLASSVVTSSLTTVGSIGTGVWQGTKVGLAYGGTNADLSATGGTSQYLKQASAGAAVTVGTIAAADLPALSGLTAGNPTLASTVAGETSAANKKFEVDYLLALSPNVPGGRLTGTSGVSVTTSNVTGITTLRYAPRWHNGIQLYDGTRVVQLTFSETSLALGTLVTGAGYDVFGYLSSGALALESLVWKNGTVTITNATPGVVTWNSHGMTTGDPVTFTTTGGLPTGLSANTRYYVNVTGTNTFNVSTTLKNLAAGTYVATSSAGSGTHTAYQARQRQTALAFANGLLCKSGDATRLYLGSFVATSTTATEDSETCRGLFNAYNREPRSLKRLETTDSANNSTSAWAFWFDSESNKVEVFRGLDEGAVWLAFSASITGSGGTASGSIGIKWDTVGTPGDVAPYAQTGSGVASNLGAFYSGCPGLGTRFGLLEWYRETGTVTFYGDAGTTYVQGGAEGHCFA